MTSARYVLTMRVPVNGTSPTEARWWHVGFMMLMAAIAVFQARDLVPYGEGWTLAEEHPVGHAGEACAEHGHCDQREKR